MKSRIRHGISMCKDLNGFIKELSSIYDRDSMNTYISLYISRSSEQLRFVDRREKTCKLLLTGEELKNFLDTMDDIRDFLVKNHEKNLAVFASRKHNFFKYIFLPVEVKNLLVVDSSPYIRLLARLHDEWESFIILLMSSNYAKIFSVTFGKIRHTKNFSADIINKHKKGGWSQARFQRKRKGSIHAFYLQIRDALQKGDIYMGEKIILAGPGTAKNQFKDILPQKIKSNIVDIIDISIDEEKKLLEESIPLISQLEERKSYETVQQLKREILRDGLAVYGIRDTLHAVKNGQVELLIIEKDYKLRGYLCENCQIVETEEIYRCRYCGKKMSEVDVVEEILEFAERTDAEVEFTDVEEISKLGHIGAILRYK